MVLIWFQWKKEKPRKTVVEEAVKAIQKKEHVMVSVKSVMKEVEQLQLAGDGKNKINVGKSALEDRQSGGRRSEEEGAGEERLSKWRWCDPKEQLY